jgi:hypothetical protein
LCQNGLFGISPERAENEVETGELMEKQATIGVFTK